METRIISLETKGATHFRDFFHLHSSERSSSLSPSCGRRAGLSPTLHLPAIVPILLVICTEPHVLISAGTFLACAIHQSTKSTWPQFAMSITSWYFAVFVPLAAILRLSLVGDENHSVPNWTTYNLEPPKLLFPDERW